MKTITLERARTLVNSGRAHLGSVMLANGSFYCEVVHEETGTKEKFKVPAGFKFGGFKKKKNNKKQE